MTHATIRVELELPNGAITSVEYEVGEPGARAGRELFDQLKAIAWKASSYDRPKWAGYAESTVPSGASSQLPADHPAIVLQDDDERSQLASYFTPDHGGEA